MTHIVKTARAEMPGSCWGRYGRVAVLEVEPDVADVAMISARARGVRRIVRLWDRRHVGGPRSAFTVALREATALRAELNRGGTS